MTGRRKEERGTSPRDTDRRHDNIRREWVQIKYSKFCDQTFGPDLTAKLNAFLEGLRTGLRDEPN